MGEPVETPRKKSLPATSRPRAWAFRIVALFIPLLLLGLTEVGLRLAGYGYPTDFFVALEGRNAHTSNLRFGWRFFPKALAREPMPTYLPKKAANSYRIFVLGGSAAQGVPDPAFSFGRILRVMLSAAYPDVEFEVLNAAMTAINSHVVLPIARDCAELEPDMFIVYMGNNEVVGPYGVGSFFRDFTPNLSVVRASVAFRATRVGQLVEGILTNWSDSDDNAIQDWRGAEMFVRDHIAAEDPRMATLYDHFRQNLRDICRVGRDNGAQVLLSTVGVNLRNSPPFASEHRPDLSEAELSAWEKNYQAGTQKEAEGRYTEAIDSYQQAAQIDDRHAELHFRMGRCHFANQELDEARKAFGAARDLDVLRFRADSHMNEIIRRVAAEDEDHSVSLVDSEKALADATRAPGLPGDDLFYEHVHLRFAGNYELARAVYAQIVPRLPPSIRSAGEAAPEPPSLRECADRLALTVWDRRSMLQEIINMSVNPPFTDQLDHEERMARHTTLLAEFARLQTPDRAERARDLYEQAIARDSDDLLLRNNYARVLLALDDNAGAEEQLRAVLKRLPDVPDRVMSLGVALWALDRSDEAEQLFQRAVERATNPAEMCRRIALNHDSNHRSEQAFYWAEKALKFRPDQADALSIVGTTYYSQGEYERAAHYLERFIRAASHLPDRDRADVHVHLALALSNLNRYSQAMEHLRQAIQIDPTFTPPRLLLAQALAGAGRPDEASEQYRSVLRLEPGNLQARQDYARLLAAEGNTTAAFDQVREAIETHPDTPELLNALAWLLATAKNETVRDPAQAIEHAERAARLTNYERPEVLNTLAVAHAEMGHFEQAVQILDRALGLEGTDTELIARLREEKQMFRESTRLTDVLRR